MNLASEVRGGKPAQGPDSPWHLALELVLFQALLSPAPVQERLNTNQAQKGGKWFEENIAAQVEGWVIRAFVCVQLHMVVWK
jgi:hypothetical protein